MPRTIVVSDLHGSTERLERALEHASFSASDRLVVAGDLVDVGPGDVVGLAESLGATILAGNHEVAAAVGLKIVPQHAATLERGPQLATHFAEGTWPLALEADGWLITHAGVSSALSDVISRVNQDPVALAAELNRMFRAEMTAAMASMPLEWPDMERFRLIGGEMGPLWFRPMRLIDLPSGLRQIVGHTPPELLPDSGRALLESSGWLLIEPGGHAGGGRAFRYALIEHGEARVFEG